MGALQAEQNAKAQAAIAKVAQADMTQEEKLSAYKQTAGYIARQESNAEYERQKALEAQRVGERNAVSIAEEYKAQEQAKQNAVDAARWAGVASVAQEQQEEENLSEIACVKETTPWLVDQIDNGITLGEAAYDADKLKYVVTTEQKNTNIRFGAPDVPFGSRTDYFDNTVGEFFDISSNSYPSGVAKTQIATGLVDDAIKGSSVLTAVATSLLANMYEYGNDAENWEEFSDKTFEKQEFLTSTAVDTILSVLIGLAAAGIVAGIVAFLGVATAPLWATVLAVAGVSIAISSGVGYLGLPDTLNANANMLIDDLQGE